MRHLLHIIRSSGSMPTSLWIYLLNTSWRVWGYGVLRHFQQYFSYIVVVSFIGTWRKRLTCNKSLTIFIT